MRRVPMFTILSWLENTKLLGMYYSPAFVACRSQLMTYCSNVVDFASAELKAAFARIDFDGMSID